MTPSRKRITRSFSLQPSEQELLTRAHARVSGYLPPMQNGSSPNFSETIRLGLHVLTLVPDEIVQQAVARLERVSSGCPPKRILRYPINDAEFDVDAFDRETRQRLSAVEELKFLKTQPSSPANQARIQELYRFFNCIPLEE
jgi:hypothetical protein